MGRRHSRLGQSEVVAVFMIPLFVIIASIGIDACRVFVAKIRVEQAASTVAARAAQVIPDSSADETVQWVKDQVYVIANGTDGVVSSLSDPKVTYACTTGDISVTFSNRSYQEYHTAEGTISAPSVRSYITVVVTATVVPLTPASALLDIIPGYASSWTVTSQGYTTVGNVATASDWGASS